MTRGIFITFATFLDFLKGRLGSYIELKWNGISNLRIPREKVRAFFCFTITIKQGAVVYRRFFETMFRNGFKLA